MAFAGSLTTDSEKLVKALGLDFDPELELKKRLRDRVPFGSQQATYQQAQTDSQYLDRVREEIET